MKNIHLSTITAGIAILLSARASAIEAPADDTPPPPLVKSDLTPEAAKPAAKADSAYLGVVSSTVPDMLAVHLGTKSGEGILVRAVMPDGPAAKAGVAVHDVITRVAGQAVGSAADLTREITSRKPGEAVSIDLIHQGKPSTVEVTLGVRPADVARLDPRPLDQLNLDGIPQELADRVRGMIQGNLGGVEDAPPLNDAVLEMKDRMEKAMRGLDVPGLPPQGKIEVHQGATIRLLDADGSIELKSNDGGKEVTLRDKADRITWTGPWDTAQDKAAAPDDVRQRVERLNLDERFQGNGLRLQMEPDDGPE